MREKDIEKHLVNRCKSGKLEPLKFEITNKAGMPDRIILVPGGEVYFVEVKAPGKKPRPLQLKRIKDLEKLGFKTYIVDSYEAIEKMIEEII